MIITNKTRTRYLIPAFIILYLLAHTKTAPGKDNPDIIYIYTDQQHANMMSCAGNKWLKTPAMDYIANNGVRFTRAYTSNPVCSPARVSLMTGRFQGSFHGKKGAPRRDNTGAMRATVSQEVLDTTIASFLEKTDYELYFGGKLHLPKKLHPSSLGFNYFCGDERGKLAEEAAKIIRADHAKPYFMVISLINPHDICYYAIREHPEGGAKKILQKGVTELKTLDEALKMPDGISEEDFFKDYCPPLPPNYEPQHEEPEAIKKLLARRKFRKNARENFTDKQWRTHRYAYHRLTEFVDKQVQVVLDALKDGGREENTLIIFSSDHGDMSASHRMEHKTALYEESANIPFMAMWKGRIPAGKVDDKHLVSNGLDLLPTVCDYAGIKGVSDPRGRSLRPLFEGTPVEWRKTLGVESEIGRMIVSEENYKFIRYDDGAIEEQLLDLNKDPHETTHFTHDPEYKNRFDALRELFLTEWFPPAPEN